jgi:hypothetical protein
MPLLTTELEWMLVGQKLNEGMVLYSEILTQIGPLSALFYQALDIWMTKNQTFYEVIAIFLIFIQTLYFVHIVNRRNLFNDKNYIPALFYLLIMMVSFDLQKLSPALLSNTFVLIALNVILKQIEKRDGVGDDVFEAGLLLGIATLFHLPSLIFIFWAVLVLFLYTGINIRQIFMVILAFILPIFFTFLYFYFNFGASPFLRIWLFNSINSFDLSFTGLRDVLIAFALPMMVSFFGIIRILRGTRYNSFQNRSHQLLIIFGLFGLISLIFSQNFVPGNLIYFVAPLAFFVGGFFVQIKKTLLPEILFLLLLFVVLSIQYVGTKTVNGKGLFTLKNYRVSKVKLPENYTNSKIFVTGEHIDAYKTNKMATGYLSWKLSRADFKNPNNYMSVVNIYNNFKKDMPDVIIDNEKVMPKIFKNLPSLATKFKKEENNIYTLKK